MAVASGESALSAVMVVSEASGAAAATGRRRPESRERSLVVGFKEDQNESEGGGNEGIMGREGHVGKKTMVDILGRGC